MQGPVAQRIRHLTTNQGIPGSNPGRVDTFKYFFQLNSNTNNTNACCSGIYQYIPVLVHGPRWLWQVR